MHKILLVPLLFGSEVKASACIFPQCVRPGFDSWIWKIPWRRKWQPTPVFLLRESNGQRRLLGCSPRHRKESDTTKRLHFHFSLFTFTVFLEAQPQVFPRSCVCVLSCARLFATPWTVTRQAALSMESPSQQYWSGLPFPALGNLPNSRIEPHVSRVSCIGRQILCHFSTWEANQGYYSHTSYFDLCPEVTSL